MSTTLSTRKAIRQAVLNLGGLAETDSALDAAGENEGDFINGRIQQALWDAQAFYIDVVEPNQWTATHTLGSFSGSDSADGGTYVELPSDFIRLYGDQGNSALRKPNGDRWGRLVEWRWRHKRLTDAYYLKNDRLWVVRGAQVPSDLVMDYYAWHATLSDSDDESTTAVDFPLRDRDLIVAYAARDIADATDIFPLDNSALGKLDGRVTRLEKRIATRGRRSREPRKAHSPRAFGNHWISTGR